MGLFFTNGYLAVGTSYELVRALYARVPQIWESLSYTSNI